MLKLQVANVNGWLDISLIYILRALWVISNDDWDIYIMLLTVSNINCIVIQLLNLLALSN